MRVGSSAQHVSNSHHRSLLVLILCSVDDVGLILPGFGFRRLFYAHGLSLSRFQVDEMLFRDGIVNWSAHPPKTSVFG
jgi:hypothetical protein